MYHLQEHLGILVRAARTAGIGAELYKRVCYRQFVVATLEDNNFNISKAAVELGLHRNTLTRQLVELDINVRAMRAARNHINKFKKSVVSERPYTLNSIVG